MKIEELIKDLDPVTIIEFKNYVVENLGEICKTKNSNSKVISNHRNGETICKNCKVKMNKNGKTKNEVQKYICKHCGYTCSETTNFRLRHKILLALKKYVKNIKLQGNTQSDEKYFSINLKGTKPNNMPRYSKKRTSTSSPYRGISHHKVCIVSSIDENDNLVLEIVGLGRCTTQMLEYALDDKVEYVNNFNTDSASAYRTFCKKHHIKLNAIPSGQHSNGEINISKINGIHSQLETWLSKFRGVSIRHLQEYLDWFVFVFTMKRKFSLNKVKTESYNTIVLDNNYIKSNDIFKIPLPIDLNVAYSEYFHQS